MLCPQCLGGDDSPAEQKLPPPTEAQSPKKVEKCVGNTVYDRQIESQMDGRRDGGMEGWMDGWIYGYMDVYIYTYIDSYYCLYIHMMHYCILYKIMTYDDDCIRIKLDH